MAARSRRRVGLTLLALLLLLAGVVAPERVMGPAFVAGASYALAAVAAAALLSVRWTAVMAILTVAVAAASGVWNQNLGSRDWLLRVAVATLFGGVAVGLSVMRIRQESALRQMTAVADAAQQAVLRPVPSRVDDVTFAARYVSASNAALVGGDLYEVVDSPYGVRAIVGDARGKGLDAVQLSATVMAVFRGGAITESSMEKIARNLDTVVCSLGEDEDFVTAVLVEFQTDRLLLLNCGHHPPLLLKDGEAQLIDAGTPDLPLGLGVTGRTSAWKWPRKARLLLYTDGLVESSDASGDFFPLLDWTGILETGSVEASLDSLLKALSDHAGQGRNDDIALLLAEHLQELSLDE